MYLATNLQCSEVCAMVLGEYDPSLSIEATNPLIAESVVWYLLDIVSVRKEFLVERINDYALSCSSLEFHPFVNLSKHLWRKS